LGAAAVHAQQSATAQCRSVVQSARQAYESRAFNKAIDEFTAALRVCGSRADLQLGLGEAQLMAGRWEPSVESLRQAVLLEPKNMLARKVLGDALYLAGKQDEAEQSLKEALRLDPNFEPARYALGRIYYQQSRFPDAIQEFQTLIAADAAHYRAHDNLALCYESVGRNADALKEFLKALDLVYKDHPEYDSAHADLAEFFLRREEPEKAFQMAAEAAQRNPRSARNFFLTGKALVTLNKDLLSLRWLERAVQLDPTYREAHYLLARTYQKLGRRDDADREFTRVRELTDKKRVRR
jgi:tetratricopeptide (TPR) repeat protein